MHESDKMSVSNKHLFSTKLDRVVRRYKGDIALINEFIDSTMATLGDLEKVFEQGRDRLTPEDSKVLRALAKALTEASDISKRKRDWELSMPSTPEVNDLLLRAAKTIKSKTFLAEMALCYIVSYQEAFAKDYLEELLCGRPELLKSSKSLPYEDALRFRSIKTLRRHLARCETDVIGHGSVDDLAAYLQRKFKIQVQQEAFWSSVREASYRRNLIVHNRGVVNEIYRSKIGGRVGSQLDTDGAYLSSVLKAIHDFVEYIHASVSRRLKISGPGHDDTARPKEHC
jgi:hypothetical protein